MRTIRVTGKGQIKVKPDMTRITLTLEGTFPEYGEALSRSSRDTESLRDLLSSFGFQRSDLKTLSFNVDTEYESYEENHVYKRRFAGYKYRHILKIEFDSDNDLLGRILYALANSPIKPEFQISYTVKDREGAKNELLGRAVTDARAKCEVLTKAAGVIAKDIRRIDYSWGEISFEVMPMNRMLMADAAIGAPMAKSAGFEMDIEPDDIEVSDTVTVVWEIE